MPIERKSYPITSLKTDDLGTIEAIVSVFNNTDSGNEIVRPGFFQKSIERKLPKGVWAHDWKQPIAKTLEARELHPGDAALPVHLMTLGGTYIKGQFNLETQRGREAYSDIKFGIVDEFSIGYRVTKDKTDEKTGTRELLEGEWAEWSPVLVGMNSETSLISIKSEESFDSFDKAVSAIEKHAQKMRSNYENRPKEGRTLSSSNRSTVQAWRESVSGILAGLDSLLEATAPREKETDDVEALRAESIRLEGEVLAALAGIRL